MTHIFERIEEALSDKVETVVGAAVWTVKTTALGVITERDFPIEIEALEFSTSVKARLNIK